VAACEAGIEPLIAVKRDEHHHPLSPSASSEPEALPANPTPVQRMKHRLKTGAGRAAYALRKQRVEPVFGIIKSVMGFRQFLTRGLDECSGRMDAGVSGVESETHGRIAPAVREMAFGWPSRGYLEEQVRQAARGGFQAGKPAASASRLA
jgi:hypothetical protein